MKKYLWIILPLTAIFATLNYVVFTINWLNIITLCLFAMSILFAAYWWIKEVIKEIKKKKYLIPIVLAILINIIIILVVLALI